MGLNMIARTGAVRMFARQRIGCTRAFAKPLLPVATRFYASKPGESGRPFALDNELKVI